MRTEDYDFAHAFITTYSDAVVWGFWHVAKVIYQNSQLSVKDIDHSVKFAVTLEYGKREKAILLKCKGRQIPLSAKEAQVFVGLDVTQKPFEQVILARGRVEIEQLNRWLSIRMNMSNLISYECGDEKRFINDYFPSYYAPPAELHPSKWKEPISAFEGDISKFEQPSYPPRNPAVAFSQYANDLLCPYCNKLNVAPEWPQRGDQEAFYNQTKERTQERPGAYRIRVRCPSCNQDWFVVWERDPK